MPAYPLPNGRTTERRSRLYQAHYYSLEAGSITVSEPSAMRSLAVLVLALSAAAVGAIYPEDHWTYR